MLFLLLLKRERYTSQPNRPKETDMHVGPTIVRHVTICEDENTDSSRIVVCTRNGGGGLEQVKRICYLGNEAPIFRAVRDRCTNLRTEWAFAQ
jgi:hypothetical protein